MSPLTCFLASGALILAMLAQALFLLATADPFWLRPLGLTFVVWCLLGVYMIATDKG